MTAPPPITAPASIDDPVLDEPWMLVLGGASDRGLGWSRRVERAAAQAGLATIWIVGVEDEVPGDHPVHASRRIDPDHARERRRPTRRLAGVLRRRSGSIGRVVDRLARIGTARWQWQHWEALLTGLPAERRPTAVVWFDDDFLTTAWRLGRHWPGVAIVREADEANR